ncbi:MAG: tRNA (guanosine(37)-N1)-methyltransferase TrmD [Holophagales bacterium]|nr:tRNA (guanosine(37)-N1)-methyltransferase TrmD [Holophagales bacterium]
MHVAILTIFPELFDAFRRTSLVGRAVAAGSLRLEVEDLRIHTRDKHRSVDDEPYGGGGGMVMTAPPWIAAVRELRQRFEHEPRVILMSPQGRTLDEAKVRQLAEHPDLLLLCGRYEGLDERVIETVVDEEISIGDFVLSGGELPAMVLVETVSRQIPGVVGLEDSVERDSFRRGLLDFPHYTRPREVEGLQVPEILLSGHHERIEAWRHERSLEATLRKRPDLLESARLDEEDTRRLRSLAEKLGTGLPAGLQQRG